MAIKKKPGRSNSIRTSKEDLLLLKEAIDSLKPDEKAALDQLMAEMSTGRQDGLLHTLNQIEYIREPVDIETFVKDEYYLGKTCENLRPRLLEDLKEFFESGYYGELIFTGCIDLNALVQGADGSLRTLREWLGRSGEVIGFSETEGAKAAPTGVAKHSGIQRVLSYELANGMSVKLTPNHKVMVWRDGYTWVPAEELEVGDLALYARKIETTPTSDISIEEAKLLAYWGGDGSSSRQRSRFKDETSLEVVDLLEHLGFEGKREAVSDKYWEVQVKNNLTSGFRDWLVVNEGAHLTKDVRVPDRVCRASNEIVAAYLNRLWACEGRVYEGKRKGTKFTSAPGFTLSSTSERFSRQVQQLLLRFGILSDLTLTEQKDKRRGGFITYSWIVAVRGVGPMTAFLREIGPILGKEQKCKSVEEYVATRKGNSNVDTLPIKRKWLSEEMTRAGIKRPAKSKWWSLAQGTGVYLSRAMFEEWCVEYGSTALGKSLIAKFPSSNGFAKVKQIEEIIEPIEVGDVCDVEGLTSWLANGSQVHNSIGWGKCICPSTEVVDSLHGRRLAGDHDKGDWSVVSADENSGKLSWNRASSFDSGEKHCVTLTLKGGQSITLSNDHPVFTDSGWKKAAEIDAQKDLIATPRKYPAPPAPLDISDEEVMLVAYLAADGGCTGPVTFTNQIPEALEEFDYLVRKLGDATQYDKWHQYIETKTEIVLNSNSGNATTLRASGVAHLAEKYGMRVKSKDKRVPANFYLLTDRQIALFLNRFWTCDGSVGKKAPLKLEVGLASEGLIDDLKYMLGRLGIFSRKIYAPKKLKGKKFDAWRLDVTGASNICAFFERVGPIFGKEDASGKALKLASSTKSNTNVDIVPIGFEELKEIKDELGNPYGFDTLYGCPKGQRLSRAKFENLAARYGYTGKYAWLAKSDILWEKVKTLTPKGVQAVVDLSVPGPHNFVANGIVVHNTFMASIAICRILYELSCMRNPHKTYGIAQDSNISVVGFSVTEEIATKVVFENIATKIDGSPYFSEHFSYERTKKEMRFPNKILVAARAPTTNSVLGLNVIAALIDEGNFMSRKSDPRFAAVDQAEIIYNQLKRRQKSRFQELGRLPGALFIVSSKMTSEDFTAKRIEASKDDPHVFVRDYALWEVFPPETYSEEKFWVIVGNEQTPSRILPPSESKEMEKYDEDGELTLEVPEGCVPLHVPEDFRAEFEADLEGSIRDIAGVATVSVSPYIQRREKIDEAIDGRSSPYSEPYMESGSEGRFLWDSITKPRLERGEFGVRDEVVRPMLNPDAPRHIHIDAALTNDCLGFAMVHIGGWKDVVRRSEDGTTSQERAPIYVVDCVLQVVPPPGDEIILGDVRKLIYDFSKHGYTITKVTLDQFQCLAKGTMVNTSRGLIPIESVEIGDLVQSRIGPRPVKNTFSFGKQPTKILSLKGGTTLEGTGKHRIEVHTLNGWKWKRLDEIYVGDVVHGVSVPDIIHCDIQSISLPVEVIEITDSEAEVFDLEVEEDPSYVANGVVSHNSADTRQMLAKKGYDTDVLSLDRTTDGYDNLKTALYEGRLKYYEYPPLLKELRELELHFLGGASAQRRRRKVDHPKMGCFVGDTRIPLLDGSVPAISELNGKEVWVYSCTPDGNIVPGKARGRYTKHTDELLDVVLDSGAVVRCTPDHRWMLRDGSYKEAKDLRPGIDRLMPINRIWPVNGGYERLTDKNGNRTLTHHMVMGHMSGNKIPDDSCVHHINHKKIDNRPENLEIDDKSSHSRKHTILRHETDPKWREKLYEGANRFNLSDYGRRVHSESIAPAGNNHKVRYIIPVKLEKPVPVYDLEVEEWHNFALSEGVFVHNSKDVADALAGAMFTLSEQVESGLMPFKSGDSDQDSMWLQEQRQSYAAGNSRAAKYTTEGSDESSLPPIIIGNDDDDPGFGGGWGGGWSNL